MSVIPSRRGVIAAALGLPSVLAAWNRPVRLGKSGLKVTRLGMGCEDVRDPSVIRKAADAGVNHFNAFSNSALMGQALRPIRKQVVLAAGTKPQNRQELLDGIDRELRAFGTDYIDLWYMTSRLQPEQITDELIEGLAGARRAGKIRACGVTTHRLEAIVPRLLEARALDVVMVACNFALWEVEATLLGESMGAGRTKTITRLRDAGFGIVAMKPLLGGLKFMQPERRAWAESLDTEAKRNAALAAALKWVLRNQHVDTSPVRMRSAEELERNLKATTADYEESDRRLLAAELERIGPYYCRMCQSCEGSCRSGLPVSDVLRFLLYAEGYGNLAGARREFAQLPAGIRGIRCETCAGCTVRCPNGVRVRAELQRAQQLLA